MKREHLPAAHNIVVGQKVDEVKVVRAKELRREMTPEELCLWQHLRRNSLQGLHFRRQQLIDGFIADFSCHAAGLVVEVDGPIHEDQADYDAERDRVFAARDIEVVRLTNAEVNNDIAAALARIAQGCRERLAGK
jgi:very-short-patch-repair endonuclease